ncbi:MAG TPA: LacI family transcriptional regulator [Planctomycetaceae bacterium]|nr:LacI family transcriptional regulator [Planctomycetaceae bacterium]
MWKQLSVLCLLVALGCDSAQKTQGPNDESGKPKVALIMKSLANEFFSTMADGAKQHQLEHAQDYDLVVNGIKDERDLSRQVALVKEMVASGVDAIVIAPADSKALVPALRKAQAAGVVVVNIDNRLDEEVLKNEGVVIPFVGPDNKTGAQKVGEYLASKLNPNDSVLMLEGIRTSFNAQQRKAGFDAAMAAANIKVASSQSAEWEMSQANTIAASMLSEHPQAKAILAANDNMALGALAAAKSAGRQDLLIVGFDNISAAKTAIEKGQLLATADQHGDKLAVYGIETALKMLNEPSSQSPEDVETPVDLITADQ